MGLSDSERMGKLMYSSKLLTQYKRELLKHEEGYRRDEVEPLMELIDEVWPALLGTKSNSGHWLLGSESTQKVVVGNQDPWSLAVLSRIPSYNGESLSTDEDPFEPKDSVLDHLSIEDLLYQAENHEIRFVVRVYQILENMIYALRRYDDDFLSDLQVLSDLIAKMQGECYSVLHENADFAECYVAHQIYSILYTCEYHDNVEDHDSVDKWLHGSNMHHYITRAIARGGESVRWLAEQHILLINSKGVDLKKNRVLVAMRMAGRRFHHEYDLDNLKKALSKDKDLNNKDFFKILDKEFANCMAAYKQDEKETREFYGRDDKDINLYGYFA